MQGLIIDEMGYVQQSREEMEVLFTLLAERYERGSVLLTSNLAFSEMGRNLQGSDDNRGRHSIRLVHHCIILELNIPSYPDRARRAGSESDCGRRNHRTATFGGREAGVVDAGNSNCRQRNL